MVNNSEKTVVLTKITTDLFAILITNNAGDEVSRLEEGTRVSKKQKRLLWLSIGLNIVLIIGLVVGAIGTKFARDQVYLSGVQRSLVLLSGGITHQIKTDWAEPQLVVQALQQTINGLQTAIENSKLTMLPTSTKDKQLMGELMALQWQYPLNETYRLVELTEEEKRSYERLGESLRAAGFGTGIQYRVNMKFFKYQIEQLLQELQR